MRRAPCVDLVFGPQSYHRLPELITRALRVTGAGILDLMKGINRSFNTTFVFSTHDKKVIAKADRLVRIEDGRCRRLGVRTDDRWLLVKERRPAREAVTEARGEEEK